MFKKGYKQTKEHKSKINTPERAEKISKTLKLKYKLGLRTCWIKGKKHSKKTIKRMIISANRNKSNHSWKGDKAGYTAMHDWIRTYFGNADMCENRKNQIFNFQCSKKSGKYEWAKKKGCRYSRNKNDYYQLCKSCHSKYDYIPKIRKCSVGVCDLKHKFYGYCLKHGQRFRKWGNPLAIKSHDNPIKYKI